jgi:pimeloyl-ACP methyl ester carboxylesterase
VEVRARFAATDDGQQLYYRVLGSGPTLVCCNGVGVSTFFWMYVAAHFQKHFRVVLWDYRGHGRSSLPDHPDSADLSMQRMARDLQCVIEASGTEDKPVLMGHSMGCQVILEHAKCFPGEARALVPMFGTYTRPLDSLLDSPYSRQIFRLIHRAARVGGRVGRRWFRPLVASPFALDLAGRTGLIDRHFAQRQDMEMYLEHLNQMDPRVLFRTVALMADHDMTDFLPSIDVPVLVIAGEDDLFTPLRQSRRMAELIPNAEFMVIPEGSHAAIVEYPDTINLRIERFLRERLGLECGGEE